MTLQNLLGISLEVITPNKLLLTQLLNAAQRNISDAHIDAVSAENRFDAAYKAIMQLAMVSLYANGYRTLTNRPGHQQTAIQGLVHSIGLANEQVWTIDALRKQRNLNDYSGDLVPESAVNACIEQALMLQAAVTDWIQTNKPDLT